MKISELRKVAAETTETAGVTNVMDLLKNAKRIDNLPEGFWEVIIKKVTPGNRGIELLVTASKDGRDYKVFLWLDEATEGQYLRQHIQNLLLQVGYEGEDLDPEHLVNGEVVIFAKKNDNGFINYTTNHVAIAREYQRMEEENFQSMISEDEIPTAE